jgi:hypothetical protein
LLCKGAYTTAEYLTKAMSKCWQISGGDINNNDNDNVYSNGHKTAMVKLTVEGTYTMSVTTVEREAII